MMTGKTPILDVTTQARMIAALTNSNRYPHPAKAVRVVETHISWVLLAGRYAYKIKKAIRLDFVDFSALERRKHCCEEEVRLNRRLAPQIYLDVIPIGGDPDVPVLDALPAIEYAVRMHRFSRASEMDSLVSRGRLTVAHIDSLAGVLARFHQSLPSVAQDSAYGTFDSARELALQNFQQLPDALLDDVGRFVVSALRADTEDAWAARQDAVLSRRVQGHVRECHGDLHLGNVAVKRGVAVPFDGVEFDPGLRWTDVICDIAFPFMDLQAVGRSDLAWRFVNGWLELTGDYGGMELLSLYASYRAAVRAKVHALKAMQSTPRAQRADAARVFHRYLALACQCLARPGPFLIITHGLPGAGKTRFSQMVLERLGAIRVRSDVERKRLFGLSAQESSRTLSGAGLYGKDVTERTYAALENVARCLLKAGHRVIVDAAFLQEEERDQFRHLARQMAVPFVIASIQASDAVMRARITERLQQRSDASEADTDVLDRLQVSSEPLQDGELVDTVTFFNEGNDNFASEDPGWWAMNRMLNLPC